MTTHETQRQLLPHSTRRTVHCHRDRKFLKVRHNAARIIIFAMFNMLLCLASASQFVDDKCRRRFESSINRSNSVIQETDSVRVQMNSLCRAQNLSSRTTSREAIKPHRMLSFACSTTSSGLMGTAGLVHGSAISTYLDIRRDEACPFDTPALRRAPKLSRTTEIN